MNSVERIKASVGFKPVDRPPVIAQVFGHAACLCGVSLKDYLSNGSILAECQLKALDKYRYDAVFAAMDVGVETEALGSVLKYWENQYPTVDEFVLSSGKGLDSLSLPNPRNQGRMPEVLKALKTLRNTLVEDVLVVGCVTGPMTLSMQLLGAEKALYLSVDAPSAFERLLDFATDVAIVFGKAQLEAGAHLPLVFNPSASPEVIPPQFFREFELPRLKKIFSAFKAEGALANWIHIAGSVQSILPFFESAGVDIANFDYCVSPEEACEALPKICLDGNIKPMSFVDANPGKITEDASALLNFFFDRGGFILSSGCEIPPESRPENIMAMVGALRGG